MVDINEDLTNCVSSHGSHSITSHPPFLKVDRLCSILKYWRETSEWILKVAYKLHQGTLCSLIIIRCDPNYWSRLNDLDWIEPGDLAGRLGPVHY